ncbi:MAG: hypothetical protein RMH84_06820, partial [Sulfolobales archaeon]|nr:hypothetical protein [Sulfolobales archaeon]
RAEVYLCRVDIPDFSTYRHVYAAISSCSSKGVYDLDRIPVDVVEKLLKRGELILTDLGEEMSKLVGLDHLEDYQYLRIVLLRG